MEQEIDIKQQLKVLLSEPEKVEPAHRPMLESLVSSYPYFQPLHLLLAKATGISTDSTNTNLATAALYTNGQTLHQYIFEPQGLASKDFQVILSPAYDQMGSQPEALDDFVLDEVSTDPEEMPAATEEKSEESSFPADVESSIAAGPNEQVHGIEQAEPTDLTGRKQDQEEKAKDDLVLENIVATDFFAGR